MSRLPLLSFSLLLSLLLLSSVSIDARFTRRHQQQHQQHRQQQRSSSWTDLQSELESEVDSGLDERELHALEQAPVSREGMQCALKQPRQCDTSGSVRVHLDISIDAGTVGSRPIEGRLSLDLFNSTAPVTVRNFLTICDGNRKKGFSYRGNRFHRVITGFMAQVSAGEGKP
jgi:hypothetical protein